MAVAVGDMRMSSKNRPDLYSFFQPKTTEAIINLITTDEDAEGGRRKRQRTVSPVRESLTPTSTISYAWQDQLQVAAYGDSTNLNKIQKPATTSSIHAVQHDAKTQEDLVVDGPKSANIPKNKGLKQNGVSTPPKKMLKVRPDGKLTSPKIRDTTSKPARGVKKKPRSEENVKRMIAVLKYGGDDELRKITAQKIQGICSKVDPKKSEKLDTAEPDPVKVEPLKPTHPFFLGPVARVSEHHSPADKVDTKDRDNDQLQRGAKHSPKKISAVQKPGVGAGAWASVGGFGGKPSVSDNPRVSRFSGAINPILPPQGMVHVGRQIDLDSNILNVSQPSEFLRTRSKLKDAAIHIPEREELLRPYADLVKSCREEMNRLHNATNRRKSIVRYPVRRIMTGPELQQAVRQNISCRLPVPEKSVPVGCKEEDILKSAGSGQTPVHKAVLQVYERIESSLTAFDKFDCETLDWVHKYAPRSAEQVLQQGSEVMHLRDWLRRLTITSVESRNANATKNKYSPKQFGLNSRKKRQKKSGDLEGFVISSDEEAAQMDELADPELDELSLQGQSFTKRSVMRAGDVPGSSDSTGSSERTTNAVVVSGPHGCGKTAAVYAVAKEMNFEVFEITAGSRRSGKDLLDKVGDMTRNHLVNRAHESKGSDGDEGDKANENVLLISDALKKDLESGRQGTMQSFFQPKPGVEKKPKPRASIKSGPKSKDTLKKPPTQKQSLILLEEVDVLFEEDRQFWVTTLELILQSKRPVILTCTDESLLPLADLPLHAILRFTPTSEPLAVDYLSLIACNEGHLLSRQAVSALYRCKGYDLRASITELNFFCQMAIGDTKGGLEWMLLRSSPQECHNEKGETLRVVSEGTYLEGMGWLSCDNQDLVKGNRIDEQSDTLSGVLEGWSMGTGEWDEPRRRKPLASHGQVKREETLKMLEALDHACNALSTADTYPRLGDRHGCSALLDPTQPPLTEKLRVNFVEGSTLLQADPLLDPTNLANSFAVALTVCTRSVYAYGGLNQLVASLNKASCIDMILENVKMLRNPTPVTRFGLSAAFSPIASSPKALSKGPYISSFENTKSVVVEEVAPYVRSIISYDMRLEEQRLRLNSLLSEGARNGKRIRTTRASRAALEGGSKADTRRERWFPKRTNFPLVLRTGGSGWQSIVLQRATCLDSDRGGEDTAPEASRQTSVASTIDGEV